MIIHLLLWNYYLLTMDNYEPIFVTYKGNHFTEMMDYVCQVSHPVQQQLLKLYGCFIGDA